MQGAQLLHFQEQEAEGPPGAQEALQALQEAYGAQGKQVVRPKAR